MMWKRHRKYYVANDNGEILLQIHFRYLFLVSMCVCVCVGFKLCARGKWTYSIDWLNEKKFWFKFPYLIANREFILRSNEKCAIFQYEWGSHSCAWFAFVSEIRWHINVVIKYTWSVQYLSLMAIIKFVLFALVWFGWAALLAKM